MGIAERWIAREDSGRSRRACERRRPEGRRLRRCQQREGWRIRYYVLILSPCSPGITGTSESANQQPDASSPLVTRTRIVPELDRCLINNHTPRNAFLCLELAGRCLRGCFHRDHTTGVNFHRLSSYWQRYRPAPRTFRASHSEPIGRYYVTLRGYLSRGADAELIVDSFD